MSAADLVAVVVTIAAVAATTALVMLSVALARTLRQARLVLADVRATATPALQAISGAAREAEAELGRVDGLLDRAESISATIEDASRLGYLAVANPVIKVAALAAGVRHGARRLRLGDAATSATGHDTSSATGHDATPATEHGADRAAAGTNGAAAGER